MCIRFSPLCLIFLLIALTPLQNAWAGPLTAELDRTRLGLNETVRLRVIASGGLSGEPDLSPLEKDFEVLNRSSSSSTTVINGAVSQSREWTLELAPRRTGPLQIPSLSLGADHTSPIALQVVTADQARAGSGPRPLLLDTLVDASSPYVQQAFVYRVKVAYLEQPRSATLSDPVAEGATIEQRGDDQSYTEQIDGRTYRVIERRYLVVPQRSGPLTISAPRLDAVLPDHRPGARRGPFADFEEAFGGGFFQGFPALPDLGSGRRVVERGPDRTLEVRPQPAGAGDPWLPAESIELADEWTPTPPRFRVGEPITRTLTITAKGLTAAQLPVLDMGAPDGVNVYPEQPQGEDLPDPGAPVALKTLKVALVPTQAGALTLPEVRLPWWDTVADRARVAVIPQRTVQVERGSAPVPQAPPEPVAETVPAISPATPQASGPDDPREVPEPLPAKGSAERFGAAGPWPWVALMLGVGWLLTLGWMLWGRRRIREQGTLLQPLATPRSNSALGKARDALRSACVAGDPRGARSALLAWGRARWPQDAPQGLGGLAMRLGGEDTQALLNEIDRAIYAQTATGGPVGWNGAALWSQIEPLLGREERRPRKGPEPLPALYPNEA